MLCCSYRDGSPGNFTAVRTAGLTSDASSNPTSPRGSPLKPPTGAFGNNSSNSPLLKAALNANLARINVQQQQAMSASGGKPGAPGSLSGANNGMLSASGAYAGGAYSGSNQPGISSNVKQRLKEYFVARNTELIASSGAAADGAAAAACGASSLTAASSDTGYAAPLSPMQH